MQAKGRIAFSLHEVIQCFPDRSENALRTALKKLSAKGSIISILKGYYLIIPPQYSSRGVLPPSLFLDGLMKYLERPYYVGLLSAASFYGAAHQQPQEYFVFTVYPVLRATKKKGIQINYVSKKEVPRDLLEKRKTETGSLTVSSPELTAADLVQFDQRIGGLNRAASVLKELVESMDPKKFNNDFFAAVQDRTIQRLGYILDRVLKQSSLAGRLYEQSQKAGVIFYRIPLKTSSPTKGFSSDERWKVIVNTDIETDE